MNAKDEQTQLVDEQSQIIEETVNEEQETSQESKRSTRVKKVAGVAGVAAAGVAAGAVFTSMTSVDDDKTKQANAADDKTKQANVADANTTQVNAADANTTQANAAHTAHTAVPAGNVKVAEVSDDMSFDEAFASARKQVGAGGVFEWRGRLYGTYYKNEWDNMSQADKDQYAANVFGTPQAKVHQTNTEEVHQKDWPGQDGGSYNIQQVYGAKIVTDDNGNPVTMVGAKVNGHQAILCDIDQDDKIDAMVIDANDDDQLTEDEIIPVPQGAILVAKLGCGVPETQPVSETDMSDVAINPMEGLM